MIIDYPIFDSNENKFIPWLYSRHQMRWTEGELLHLGEVVAGVPVEGELAHRVQGELSVRPDLRSVT